MSWKRKVLNSEQEQAIEDRIARLESATGAEFCIAILKASDPYPAAALRFGVLFALTIATATLSFQNFQYPIAIPFLMLPLIMLGNLLGKTSWLKRHFMQETEVRREVREKAKEIFRDIGLGQTENRVGCLLLISLQERKLEVLVDQTLNDKISETDLINLINLLEAEFSEKKFFDGIIKCINKFEEKILHFFPEKIQTKKSNEVPNRILWDNFSR